MMEHLCQSKSNTAMRKTKLKIEEEPSPVPEEFIKHPTENMSPEDDANHMIRIVQLQNDILLRIKENLDQADAEKNVK